MRLIADIGATNARFALLDEDGTIREPHTLPVAAFPTPAEAVRRYLSERGAVVREAALAVAAPVDEDPVRFLNSPWILRRRELQEALGLSRLLLLNDLQAQALAVAALQREDLPKIGGGPPLRERPAVVIGPGTGLGTAALVPCEDAVHAVATEAGHMALAAETAEERRLLALLAERFGHVSRERVLSGPGLVHLAHAQWRLAGRDPGQAPGRPAEVVERARRHGCPLCQQALRHFSALLGAYAGDLALAYGALGGVFLVGALLGRLGDGFDCALFRRRFEAKGRLGPYLARIPVYRVEAPDLGLRGAALALAGGAGKALAG